MRVDRLFNGHVCFRVGPMSPPFRGDEIGICDLLVKLTQHAEDLLNGGAAAPPHLGAVILGIDPAEDMGPNPIPISCYWLIDGHQRFMALQLLLAALEAWERELSGQQTGRARALLRNGALGPNGPFKLAPRTDPERNAFAMALIGGMHTLARAFGPRETWPELPAAYARFHGAIGDFIGHEPGAQAERLNALIDGALAIELDVLIARGPEVGLALHAALQRPGSALSAPPQAEAA